MQKSLVELRMAEVAGYDRRILGPVSLPVGAGELLAVLGPNGAGKSTLLHVVAGLRPLTSGEIRWARLEQRRRWIGLLLQSHGFVLDLPFSALDVVMFGRIPWRRPGRPFVRADFETAERALSHLGLIDFRNRLYRELSGGERQKVQLARLLAQDAELLLLDEPTAGLDLEWQEKLTDLIGEIHERHGKTVVMVTHDFDSLPPACSRVLLLSKGRMVAEGLPREVLNRKNLSELFGPRSRLVTEP